MNNNTSNDNIVIYEKHSQFEYPIYDKEPKSIEELLFNKFNFQHKADNLNAIDFSKTTQFEELSEDLPNFDILQCTNSMNCYFDTVDKMYKRLLLDQHPPSGDDDENDIDLLTSIIKNEIKNKEEEISFSMKECYRIFAFLKNNIEGYNYDTSYMDDIIDKLFSQSNIALENINELYIKI